MGMLEKLVLAVMVVHILVCPFTKVEESFNLQAMHDILYLRENVTQYDHHEFPGVVPRTFLGPLFVSAISAPAVFFSNYLGFGKFISQCIVRMVLGVAVLYSFVQYRKAVGAKFGQGTAKWLLVITATQFHTVFYMSRPLPNTFAMAVALLSISWWLKGDHFKFIWSAALAILVFRFELCILLGLMLLAELFSRRITIGQLLMSAIPAGCVWLGLSVLVDSFFWGRWLWPEGEVLWFNTVLNKSSQWGTSPFPWYFYSVLPRALSASLLMVPLGLYLDTRTRTLLWPALGFVLVFSILPHKELRFILYVFPLFNTVAAAACSRLWLNRKKSLFRGFLALSAIGHLVINLATTSGFLYIASINYPGGEVISQLHSIERKAADVHVHIDVDTAQTGVSRFSQLHDRWRYSKTEDLAPGGPEMLKFTHLCVGVTSPEATETSPYASTHATLDVVHGFSGVRFKGREFPPIEIVTEPKIYLLKKKGI